MTARIVQIADALVADINAESWVLPFTARRRWMWHLSHEDIPEEDVLVSVIPRDVATEIYARRRVLRTYGLVLAVQRKLRSNTQQETDRDHIDVLVELCEQLWKFIEPTEGSEAVSPSASEYVSTEHEDGTLLMLDQLEQRLFSSLTVFSFCEEK